MAVDNMNMKHLFAILILTYLHPPSYAQTKVDVNTPGTLSALLTDTQKDTCRSLVVSGKLNSADIRVLRQMGGYGDEGGKTGRLETLDLKDARFVNDKEPFMVLDAAKDHLAGTAVPGRVTNWSLNTYQSTDASYGNATKWSSDNNFAWREYKGLWALYYYPKFFLGHDGKKSVLSGAVVYSGNNNGWYQSKTQVTSKDQYLFAKGVDDRQWKMMKRQKITRFRGHRLEKDGDNYKLYVSTDRKRFYHDMFYKCASLKTVVLPVWASIDYSVVDLKCGIKYVQSSPTTVKIYYTSPHWEYNFRMSAFDFFNYFNEYIISVKTLKSKEQIDSLQKYIAGTEKLRVKGKPNLNFRLMIVMSKEGESEDDIYYCDEERVLSLSNGSFYAINSKLLDLFVSLKVKKPDVGKDD